MPLVHIEGVFLAFLILGILGSKMFRKEGGLMAGGQQHSSPKKYGSTLCRKKRILREVFQIVSLNF